jgi:membrane associated rhomboid family serine protease
MDDASGPTPDSGGTPEATAQQEGSGSGLQMEPCYRHPHQFTGVHCTRCGKPICVDCMKPAAVGYQCPDCLAAERSSGYKPQRGVASLRAVPRVTQALIAINVGMFVAELATGGQLDASFSGDFNSRLVRWGALQPGRIALYHEYWRLVTAMFLHGGLLHIGLNMYVLWVLGTVIEPAYGPRRFLAIYLVSGLFGSVASFLFSSPFVTGVGASGAIFGLLGAWVAYNLRRRGSPVASAQLRWALFWIGINLVIGFSFSGIDNLAHLGGLVGGLAAGYVAEGIGRRKDDLAIQVAGFAVLIAVAIALAAFRIATFPFSDPLQFRL